MKPRSRTADRYPTYRAQVDASDRAGARDSSSERSIPTNLARLIPTTNQNDRVPVQDTECSQDVLGRYICSTWDEAVNNGGVAFYAIVIGAGMFGACCRPEKIYRHANARVLVLEAGSFLVTEHVQNLSRIGLNAGGAVKSSSTTRT